MSYDKAMSTFKKFKLNLNFNVKTQVLNNFIFKWYFQTFPSSFFHPIQKPEKNGST